MRLRPAATGVTVAYTPMHGVGGAIALRAFAAAGLPEPLVVESQFEPDPTFPTVSFPNPEEPGAMDLVMALAAEHGAQLALANDPDADRLGAAIPQPDGSWRRLGGDELGWLLADHILGHTAPTDGGPDDRMVVTTLVSSSLLGSMATDYGVHFAETFTGFKWIGRAILDHPDRRFVFGYEQALGYLVAPRPLDKDGITAAVLLAEVAAVAAEEGTTMQARLDEIAARYGRHVIADRSIAMDPAVATQLVRDLLADPPETLGGAKVIDVTVVPGGRPPAADARGRRARPGPPQRHRTQGQAVRRSRRRRPHPLPGRAGRHLVLTTRFRTGSGRFLSSELRFPFRHWRCPSGWCGQPSRCPVPLRRPVLGRRRLTTGRPWHVATVDRPGSTDRGARRGAPRRRLPGGRAS